jgi:hypothetical protein
VSDEDRCPKCGHQAHDTLGFCPNMASDNDCNCTHGTATATIVAADGSLTVQISERMEHPTKCTVWRNGVVIFDGASPDPLVSGGVAPSIENTASAAERIAHLDTELTRLESRGAIMMPVSVVREWLRGKMPEG